ncbi:nSTAND1 domain-containing NTPase [Sunxiuqinia dokdonensis]|uniref:AAA+ ATPase domain-containing protein n=1 Tax=Sunxiuqinia dokdonensis TaxID=1409788 RepID=A0A0L8VC09_9BACT|nr:ATP-binding protein [Sunxiuqinia dokdonensis]KOH45996.1 hypothetical protein NC99_11860 [Sunxiuqinia dokdonensis]
MDKISLRQIENAFLPAKEILNAENFAGRKAHVIDSFSALISEGANIAVVGNRGIGKSSLARQIINISQGNNELLKKLEIQNDEKLDFLAIYIACGNAVNDIQDLLVRLLTTRDCLLEWIYEIPTAKKEIDKINAGIDLRLIKAGGEGISETSQKSAVSEHQVDVIFQNVITDLLKLKIAKDGILIVVDEFDQIENPKGFARLLKSLATNAPGLKFCIIGVANDIQTLIKEHESSDRLFAGSVINLPSMSPEELTEIIKNAERSVGSYITFTDNAINKMVSLANGHPYIIHLIGKQAYRSAYLEGIYELDDSYIEQTLKNIAEKEADPVLEGRYKKTVASSYQREATLKSLASCVQVDGEVHTGDAYKIAIDKQVDNPSQYVGQMVTEDYGAEIIKVRDRYYRFKDSLFLTYVKARPWIFSNQ